MRQHLLFAEDDASVREVVAIDLSETFQVSLAATVDSALHIISESSHIDFLVTDWNMNDGTGRSGFDIAKKFRLRFSMAPIVLATGSSLSNFEIDFLRNELNGILLAKPYESSALVRALTDAELATQNLVQQP